MIKKILAHAVPAVVSIGIAMGIISLVSCGATESHATEEEPSVSSFTSIGRASGRASVVRHDATGVLYLFDTAKGGWCVMVDREGKPLVWEGN